MPRRVDGWDVRLRELVDSARPRAFAWGVHDCCTFALADFEAMMGEPAPNVEPWANLLQAQRLLRLRSVSQWATLWFGEPVDGWRQGRRGDIALISATLGLDSDEALGVVLGSIIAAPTEGSLIFVPLRAAQAIWRIGS